MHAGKTIFLQCCCSAKTRDILLTAVIFTSLTFATQPAGPWIRKRSRRGTQAWQFLSNEVPIALQVYLKTLRRQQHQPHHHELANKNPHASRQQASQASESARAKNTKSNNGPKFMTAIHPAAHPTSRPAQGLIAQPISNSSTLMLQTPTQQRRPHRQEPAWHSDPGPARRCWSELDTTARVIF